MSNKPAFSFMAVKNILPDSESLYRAANELPVNSVSVALDKLINKSLAALNLNLKSVKGHPRPVMLYEFDNNIEIESLIKLNTPSLISKSATSDFKDVLSVWLPYHDVYMDLLGIIVHYFPGTVSARVTYVYDGGSIFTDAKIFNLRRYSSFSTNEIAERVTHGGTLKRHWSISGDINKKHNVTNTFFQWPATGNLQPQMDIFQYGTGLDLYENNDTSADSTDIHTTVSTDSDVTLTTYTYIDPPLYTAEKYALLAEQEEKLAPVPEVLDKTGEITILKNMLKDMTGMMEQVLNRLPAKESEEPASGEDTTTRDRLAETIKRFDNHTIESSASRQRQKPFGMVSETKMSYPNISNDDLARLFDNNIKLLNGRMDDIEDKNITLENRLLLIEKKFYREGISLLD